MSQADLHYTTTRRTALAAIASAAGAATTLMPAIAANVSPELAAPDPIFAAIEARKQTDARFAKTSAHYGAYQESHRHLNGDLPEDGEEVAENDAAADEDNEAILALLSTTPTTLVGALALLQYVAECENEGDEILMGQAINDGGYGYHTLIATLIAALTPLAA
jgi:hypothetical protein